ncbi:MAG: TIGR03435 family protein [Vicinamibacterales bacterium]
MNRARFIAMLLVALGTLSAYAQERIPAGAPQNGPRFDVVSIKRSQTKDTDTSWGVQPGGRWRMHNLAVSVLIREAFPAQVNDLIGAPDWVTSDRYDIEARAEGNPTREQMRPMLQTLVAERFQFAAHYETVERPVFALVVARTDGRTRPGLVRSSIDCAAVAAARRENREPDVPAPANGARPCAWNASYGPDGVTVRFGGLPLSRLAESVGTPDGRVIIDRTGLTGGYEFTLTFTQQPAPGDDNASLFTALEEQLGLKLVPDRAPLRVLVVDRIERPREN